MKNRRDFLKLGALAALGASIPGCRKADKPQLEAFTGPLDPLRAYPYRGWEDLYRKQWTWDKVVRSTHSANCTGSCSWNVYVRNGVMIREEQAADYPRISADLPDYNPRGCQKGACFTEYVYGPQRLRSPLIRAGERGEGKWRKATWDEALTMVAGKLLDNIYQYGPDTNTFFSVIPAMSPVSFCRRLAVRAVYRRRLLLLLRLVLRPAAGRAAHLGRADRILRVRRLVQLQVHRAVGQQHLANPHPRRPFRLGGALQRRQDRGHLAGLQLVDGAHRPVPLASSPAPTPRWRWASPSTSSTTISTTRRTSRSRPICRCWWTSAPTGLCAPRDLPTGSSSTTPRPASATKRPARWGRRKRPSRSTAPTRTCTIPTAK